MPDFEKVIKGLEMHGKKRAGVGCLECPYAEAEGGTDDWCIRGLHRDILALLKEQEPRILSWDEIKKYPVVYGEFKGVSDIYPLIITLDNSGQCLSWNPGINVTDEYFLLVSDEEDRKNTRCWNRMPTDEQRKAVKWE